MVEDHAASRPMALPYVASLDGLRGIAILGVFIEHFPPHYRLATLSPGGAGVSMFFVLSGYLITRILLNYGTVDVSLSRKAYHFFVRRFLRLSPAFVTAIALAYAFDVHHMREHAAFHLLYLTNMLMAWRGDWLNGADHFWSLCVEEQFYLIWFFAIILLRRGELLFAILAAVLLTLVTRLGIMAFGLSPLVSVTLSGQSAVLAVGALLAVAESDRRAAALARPFGSLGVLVVAALAFTVISLRLDVEVLRVFAYPFAAALLFGCVIRRAVAGQLGAFGRLLCLPPLLGTGRISYGLFVYHAFLPSIIYVLVPGTEGWLMRSWSGLGLVWVLSFVVAWLSWRLIEQPCLRLKDRVSLYPAAPVLTRA